MNGSGTSGGGGGVPSSVGGLTAHARSKLARRSATVARRSPPSGEGVDQLVAVEVEDVVGVVDDALVDEPLADGQGEAAEHADEQLVDVEGVVLGEREAVARRLVQLVELGQRVRVVGEHCSAGWPAAPRGGPPAGGTAARGPRCRRRRRGRRCWPAGSSDPPATGRRRGRTRRRGASRTRTGTRRAAGGRPVPRRWRRAPPAARWGPSWRTARAGCGSAPDDVRLSAHRPRAASTERVWNPCRVWYDSVGSSGWTTLS